MDPVSQVLAQQQSGSAGGQGFGQFFVAGQQNARQREQLNLANRAEKRMQERQTALMPYEQSLMAAQIVAAGQTAEFNRQKMLTMVQQNRALPEIMSLESYFMQAPDGYKDANGVAAYQQLYSKYPQAFAQGAPGHDLRMRVQMPTVLDAEMKRLNDANAKLQGTGQGAGLFVQRFDDRGGPVLGEMNQPRARPDKLEVADEMTSLQRIIASPNSPPDLKRQAENQLANIQAQMGASSMEVLDPATGNTIMRQTTGRQPAAASAEGLTPANLTEVNKKIISTDIALHELDRAEQLIEKQPEAFGLRGVANEAIETGRGVLDPAAPATISNARNQAAITFTQIADSLRVDSGNMSLYERRQLEKAGDITSWATNPAAARGKINNVRNALVGGQLRRIQARGGKPKDELLRQLAPTEFDDAYSSGLLGDDDAMRWFKLHNSANTTR